MRLETIAVHAGHAPDEATGAVTPPIHLSTTFEREPDLSFRGGFLYSRYANPNRQALEACLARSRAVARPLASPPARPRRRLCSSPSSLTRTSCCRRTPTTERSSSHATSLAH